MLASVEEIAESPAVKGTSQDGDAVLFVLRLLEIDGQKDVAVRQVVALDGPGAGVFEPLLVGHFQGCPGAPFPFVRIVDCVGRLAITNGHDAVVPVAHGLSDAEKPARCGVPLGRPVTGGHYHAGGFVPPSQGLLVGGGFGPGSSEVVRADFVYSVEDIASGQEQFLEGHDDFRGRSRDNCGPGVDPTGLLVESGAHGVEADAETGGRGVRLVGRRLLLRNDKRFAGIGGKSVIGGHWRGAGA